VDLLVTKIEERSRSTMARNRFIAATPTQAIERMEIQSIRCLDQVAAVNGWPWMFTNAGVLAEACAHWAFIAHPELRVDDNFWECDYCASIEAMTGTRNCPIHG
jgi:hypothetical protein